MVTGFNHPARQPGTDGSGLGMRPRRTQQPGFRHGGGGGGVRKGDLGQFTKGEYYAFDISNKYLGKYV